MADLTVNISENITLNNQVIESSDTRTITGIGEISKRILTITTNATQDADAASDTNLGSLTNIQADAGASTCDLEMFIAST